MSSYGELVPVRVFASIRFGTCVGIWCYDNLARVRGTCIYQASFASQ